jgi:protease I
MQNALAGCTVAILATDGVELVELIEPRNALEMEGAKTELVSPREEKIQGMNHLDKGDQLPVERSVAEAHAGDYDALMIPGGVANPDDMRMDADAVRFVREFFEQRKPVAAICHAPWMLVEAGVVEGRTLTSWPSLKTDIRNAGGHWVDEQVHAEGGIITSRKPDDIPAFNKKMIAEFANAKDQKQRAAS